MNRNYSARDQERQPLIGPFSWAMRAGSREPGSTTARRALLRRLVPANGATYHANTMSETGCERVGLPGERGEANAPFYKRCGRSYSGSPGPANAPSGDVLSRS